MAAISQTIFYGGVKDRAHVSTFKIFIFDKFSCFIVLVVFLVIAQSSEFISLWFCEKKMTLVKILPYLCDICGRGLLGAADRMQAVSGACLPSVDGLVVRCIQATGLDAWASSVKCPARFVSHLHEICTYIWVVYSLCFFCCLFITVTWWYVWCFEWASGNQEEVQACLVT